VAPLTTNGHVVPMSRSGPRRRCPRVRTRLAVPGSAAPPCRASSRDRARQVCRPDLMPRRRRVAGHRRRPRRRVAPRRSAPADREGPPAAPRQDRPRPGCRGPSRACAALRRRRGPPRDATRADGRRTVEVGRSSDPGTEGIGELWKAPWCGARSCGSDGRRWCVEATSPEQRAQPAEGTGTLGSYVVRVPLRTGRPSVRRTTSTTSSTY